MAGETGTFDIAHFSEFDGEEENWTETLYFENDEFFPDATLEKNLSKLACQDEPNGVDNHLFRPTTSNFIETENEQPLHSGNSEKPIHRMALNDHKAGMKGLDKERINEIIFEASKGSRFYENERKKEKRVAEKIKLLQEEFNRFKKEDFKSAKKSANKFVRETEKKRVLSKIIVHVDMDAFYAAVETRDNPSLKDIPMAVGSMSMLSTSNYAARRYGVRAAMPGFIAKKLCPHLTIVEIHSEKYKNVSDLVRTILARYDPNFCGMGLDEAYLDLTDYVAKQMKQESTLERTDNSTPGSTAAEQEGNSFASVGDSNGDVSFTENKTQETVEKIVNEMRLKIYEETQLTASAGIAANVMLAKVCSDINKPNGQYYLAPDRISVMEFVKNLPIRQVSGIGRVSEQVLNSFGITKCGDLYEKRVLLYLLFSGISFQHFMRISLGISSTMLDGNSERKSLSTETTFSEISNPEKLLEVCHDLCQTLCADMKKENLTARSVGLKMKLVNFELKTRTRTIGNFIKSAEDLFSVAKEILNIEIKATSPRKLRLRLMGVRVADFSKQKNQQNKLEDLFMQKSATENVEIESGTKFQQTLKITGAVSQSNPLVPSCSSSGVEIPTASQIPESTYLKTLSGTVAIPVPPQTEPMNNGTSYGNNASSLTRSTEDSRNAYLQNEIIICPICLTKQPTNTDINTHIDSCLNKQAIRKLLQQERSQGNNSTAASHEAKSKEKSHGQKRKSSEIRNASSKKRTLVTLWKKKSSGK